MQCECSNKLLSTMQYHYSRKNGYKLQNSEEPFLTFIDNVTEVMSENDIKLIHRWICYLNAKQIKPIYVSLEFTPIT